MKSLCTALLLVFITMMTLPSAALSDELTPEKQQAIEKLLEITGSKKIGLQMGQAINQSLAAALQANNPNIPDRAYEILAEETNNLIKNGVDDLLNSLIPLYHKYFSKAEIDELLAFYESPIGKKSIATMPQLVSESMALGQNWGQSMVPELLENLKKRFKDEGIEINNL